MPLTLKKLTPILYVKEIEPVLPFWTERLGVELTTEVPEGDGLGFVILARDGVEVMYQTRASVESDVPSLADIPMTDRESNRPSAREGKVWRGILGAPARRGRNRHGGEVESLSGRAGDWMGGPLSRMLGWAEEKRGGPKRLESPKGAGQASNSSGRD